MALKLIRNSIEDLVEVFNENFVFLNKKFVNRTEELSCIQLALLTKSHVMLEGPAGIAKSLLARSVFNMFSEDKDATIFRKQLTPTTHPEEIFGPMDVKKFKAESVFEFNPEGLLPTAHFAYLDEVYRGSEALLASIMGILNEREFFNGKHRLVCPLITCIGTCNFKIDSPELTAFHDRWLFTLRVKPAKTSSDRIKILMSFLDNDLQNLEVPNKLSLNDLKRLQTAVLAEEVPEDFVTTYSDIVQGFQLDSSNNNQYVSDRRFCQAFNIAKAYQLLHKDDEDFDVETGIYDSFLNMSFAMATTDDSKLVFDSHAGNIVSSIAVSKQEERDIKEIENKVQRIFSKFDNSLSKMQSAKLRSTAVSVVEALKALPASQQFTMIKNQERLVQCIERLDEIILSLDALNQ